MSVPASVFVPLVDGSQGEDAIPELLDLLPSMDREQVTDAWRYVSTIVENRVESGGWPGVPQGIREAFSAIDEAHSNRFAYPEPEPVRTEPEHTTREIADIVQTHFGTVHANHRSNASRLDARDLVLTLVNGWDHDDADDVFTWFGEVEDAATGDVIGEWSALDHHPVVDVIWYEED